MKTIQLTTTIPFTPVHLIVAAGVRYWEDGTVNGVQDEQVIRNGSL